jgi:hypothetical protein
MRLLKALVAEDIHEVFRDLGGELPSPCSG